MRSAHALAIALLTAIVAGCASTPPGLPEVLREDFFAETQATTESKKPAPAESTEVQSPAISPDQVEYVQALGGDKADTKPVFEIRGRIHADSIFVSQSERDKAIIGNVQNATGFRRARLGAQGTVGEQVDWVSEFDFAGGNVSFKDIFVDVTELPLIDRIRLGHMNEPFSLEGLTSSNHFTFVERSPIMALDPARNWGLAFFSHTASERATLAFGAFRSGTSNNTGNDISDQNDWAYTARVTGLPWYREEADGRYLVHLGAAFSQRFPHDNTVVISQGPQSNLLTVSDNPASPFVPKLSIPASQNQLYNLEFAWLVGSFSLQVEWTGSNVDQIGGPPVFLYGSYVLASWFLTGENREYVTRDGFFGKTIVRSPFLCLRGKPPRGRGPGAWELTARAAYANFSSPNLPLGSDGQQVGNRESEFSLGVNWYLNDNARIMFNYVHAVPVVPTLGPSFADEFVVRTAIFW